MCMLISNDPINCVNVIYNKMDDAFITSDYVRYYYNYYLRRPASEFIAKQWKEI